MANDKVSLEKIRQELAAAGDPWEAGVTSMSVLSPAQQRARLGVTPPPGTPDPGDGAACGPGAGGQRWGAGLVAPVHRDSTTGSPRSGTS